jgi:hypothetical protein
MHHTKTKGDIGVGFVVADLLENGIVPALPMSEHLPFDIVAISACSHISRVSVKYREKNKYGCVVVPLSSVWADKKGNHVKKADKSLFDVTAIYCPDTKKVYYVRNDETNEAISLRIDKPKNNQMINITSASDYEGAERLFG